MVWASANYPLSNITWLSRKIMTFLQPTPPPAPWDASTPATHLTHRHSLHQQSVHLHFWTPGHRESGPVVQWSRFALKPSSPAPKSANNIGFTTFLGVTWVWMICMKSDQIIYLQLIPYSPGLDRKGKKKLFDSLYMMDHQLEKGWFTAGWSGRVCLERFAAPRTIKDPNPTRYCYPFPTAPWLPSKHQLV